jgi:hypothetical protein
MTANRNVTATFTPTYTLTVSKIGDGAGTVTGGSINCGATCTQTSVSGTTVTLTAAPSTANATRSTFEGWSGDCTGFGTCTVTLNAAKNVTANFKLQANIIFVTSTMHNGNLGGIDGADAICKERAAAGGLPGTYRAYLSYRKDPNTPVNAPDRFQNATGWVRPDGKVVMSAIEQMHKGTILSPPRMLENGADVTTTQSVFAWTGTHNTGVWNQSYGECQLAGVFAPWGGPNSSAFFGDSTKTTYEVVQFGDPFPCDVQMHLYCLGIDRKANVQ